jgi:outer membrane protein assembly factor BamB
MARVCYPRGAAVLLGGALACCALAGRGPVAAQAQADDWPQFRGPDGQGRSGAKGLPLTWGENDNVAWKAAVPGRGWSSPAVVGSQVWLTTAGDGGRVLKVLCLDRDTGKLLHDVTVRADNKPKGIHADNSFASPSPVVEGGRVYAHFGQYGTFCLSTAGKLLWRTSLRYRSAYGPSSSPVVCGGLLIVPCYGTNVRYLAALDKKTGKRRWKKSHSGSNAESTPLVVRVGAAGQVVTTTDNRVSAHDAATGRKVWWATPDWGHALVPRPVAGLGTIFVCGGYANPTLCAFRLGGKGDVTKTHLKWSTRKDVPRYPSPVLAGAELYLVSDGGVAQCLDARTGKRHWRHRLPGGYYASPLYADGRLFFTNKDGLTTVVAAGTRFRKLAANSVHGRTFASLAVAGKSIFLRSENHLYRIEKK